MSNLLFSVAEKFKAAVDRGHDELEGIAADSTDDIGKVYVFFHNLVEQLRGRDAAICTFDDVDIREYARAHCYHRTLDDSGKHSEFCRGCNELRRVLEAFVSRVSL